MGVETQLLPFPQEATGPTASPTKVVGSTRALVATSKGDPGPTRDDPQAQLQNIERRLFAEVPLRKKLHAYLATSTGGLVLDVFSTLMSALALAIYVLELYKIGDVGDHYSWSWYLELLLSALFAIEWMLRLYVAPSRLLYLYSIRSIVDILTVVPIFATANQRDHDAVIISFLRVLRVLRVLRLHRLVSYTETEVQRLLFFLGYTVASVIFVTAGILEQVERKIRADEDNGFEKMHLHDAVYLVCITISTVGYGDVSPRSNMGRFVIIMMLCVTFTIIPYQMNQLATVLGLTSVYRRLKYRPRSSSRHVLVCGDLSVWMVENFCDEFFHEDHGFGDMDVVLFANVPPSSDLALYMRTSKNSRKIKYIEGSPMSKKDLARSGAATARACFFLCNKFCKDDDKEDARNVLLALSVWQYISCHTHLKRMPRMLIQLIKPENKHHLLASMRLSHQQESGRRRTALAAHDENTVTGGGDVGRQRDDVFHDHNIVCIDEMKLNLMGQNLRCPGLSTLLSNLVRTCSEVPPPEANEEPWMYEYAAGASHEVYRTAIAPSFVGWLFEEVAEEIYLEHGCLLIGLELCSDSAGAPLVLLAPFGYRLAPATRVLGFVLAHNVQASMLVARHVPAASRRWQPWPERVSGDLPSVECLLQNAAHKLVQGDSRTKTSVWGKKYQVADSLAESAVMSARLSRHGSNRHSPPRAPPVISPRSARTQRDHYLHYLHQHQQDSASGRRRWRQGLSMRLSFLVPSKKRSKKMQSVHIQPLKSNPGLFTPLSAMGKDSARLGSGESPREASNAIRAPRKTGARSPLSGDAAGGRGCNNTDKGLAGQQTDTPEYLDADDGRDGKGRRGKGRDERKRDADYVDPDILTRWEVIVERALDNFGYDGRGALKHDLFAVIRRLNKLQEMYYLTPSRELADCTLHQVTFSGHILVCGPSAGLQHLIAPLRRITLPGIRPVVVLYSEPPLHQEWDTICMFPDVYFVEGMPSNANDLYRANVSQAHRAVILARGHAGDLPSQAALADAETIFTYQHMRSLNPRLEIVCELVSGSSLTFLQPFHTSWSSSGSEFYFAPLHAAGLVYVSSMLDTLICQAFFNKHIVGIIHALVAGFEVAPLLASDKDSKPGSLSSTSTRPKPLEKGVPPDADTFPGDSRSAGDGTESGPAGSGDDETFIASLQARKITVLQIGVPEQFVGATYRAFFTFMVEHKRIPLGLFRAAHAFGNRLPYVYTNPQPNTIIMRDDRAFVICEEPSTPGGAKVGIPLAGLNRHGSETLLNTRSTSCAASPYVGHPDTAPSTRSTNKSSKNTLEPASARSEITEVSAGTPGPDGAPLSQVAGPATGVGHGPISTRPSRSDSVSGHMMSELMDLGLPASTRSTPMSHAHGLVIDTSNTIHEEAAMSVAAGQALRHQHERSHEVLVQLLVGMQSRMDHQVNGLRRELQELQKIVRNK